MRIESTDFDLHGLAGIRLLNATPGDIAAVERQLGPIQNPLSRAPDIVVNFVDQIEPSSPVHFLGVDDVGFTDDLFLVFRGKQKARVKAQIPFHQIGNGQCQIVCESGLPAVPLLLPILNLAVLSTGALPLHASAFNYNGKGVVVTGWSKGGKTEMLLAYMARGAEYVGDEWIYISQDGQCMFGIPEPIRVWHWQLQEMPQYKERLRHKDRARLQGLSLLVNLMDRLDGSFPSLRRASVLLRQQLNAQIPPARLFDRTARGLSGTPEKIVFVGSRADSRLLVQPIPSEEIARRMVFSLQEERAGLMAYYLKYRFAFPERTNPFIEQVEAIQRSTLIKVLAGKDSYAVYHPYPVKIPALYEFTHPYLT